MKKRGINPIEVVTGHLSALQDRLKATADPTEKQFLHKRLLNLQGVLDFLASMHPDNTPNAPSL